MKANNVLRVAISIVGVIVGIWLMTEASALVQNPTFRAFLDSPEISWHDSWLSVRLKTAFWEHAWACRIAVCGYSGSVLGIVACFKAIRLGRLNSMQAAASSTA